MPKILNYTPPWLARPSPGSQIFTGPSSRGSQGSAPMRASQLGSPNGVKQKKSYEGPRRLIAKRGTEIFTVVDNQIRWANLVRVKSDWEEQTSSQIGNRSHRPARRHNGDAAAYRILTVPVYQEIRQLVISPSTRFLAILTEHTVHVAILPDTSRLSDPDRTPLKLKTYQLGPTTHVIPQSPLVCALWHPLAVSSSATDCLLTITAESAVRVWELDRSNQWSFDQPALAIDLKKLIDGTSSDQDFAPTSFGKNRGFSADFFDMEASSASFGGSGLPGEDAWAAMTLWVAMRNGDLYALCPLLPSKWRAPGITLAALSTHVVSKRSCIEDGELDPDEERNLRQQFEWVQELDSQEPSSVVSDSDPSTVEEFWFRPSNASAIPKLQGPFDVELADESEDLEISDIHVMAGKLDFEEIFSGEQVDFADDIERIQDNLAATIICVATTDAVVHILLDMEGVSGQWLPPARSGTFTVPISDPRDLLLVESLNTNQATQQNTVFEWPMFTSDITRPYELYLTSSQQVSFISLDEWASRLDREITSSTSETAGLALRIRTICEASAAFQERLLVVDEMADDGTPALLSAPALIQDSELGNMLLTSTASRPYAVSFDQPENTSPALLSQSMLLTTSPLNMELVLASTPPAGEPATLRDPYESPRIFSDPPTAPLKEFLEMNLPPRQRLTLKQNIRMSPATLDVMSLAHRTLATPMSKIERAAADLFRRCEQLREELGNQVKQMSELSSRMQRLDADDEDDEDDPHDFESRIEGAKERQQRLSERHEALRRKLARVGNAGKELSAKEIGWAHEITGLAKIFGLEFEEEDVEDKEEELIRDNVLDRRYSSIKQLADELLAQAKSLRKEPTRPDSRDQAVRHGKSTSSASPRLPVGNGSMIVPSRLRETKLAEANAMMERETAVIEAVMARLKRLNVEY